MSTGQIVKRSEQVVTVKELLEKNKAGIALALPKHITPDRMLRLVMTSVQTTPALLECEPRSLLAAVMLSAQLGLEPGPLGHAYFIPFNNRKTNRKEVQFIPGYRGMIDLARRSGQIESLQAQVVYEKDEFEFRFGTEQGLTHRPKLDGDRGQMIAVYAIAKLKGGETQIEVLPKSEVQKIRARSKAKDDGPWVTDEPEMWRKTAVRRLFKYLPVSVEMSRAVVADEQNAAGLPQDLSDVIDVDGEVEAEDEQKSQLDRLADKIG